MSIWIGDGIAVTDVRNKSGAKAVEPPGQARWREVASEGIDRSGSRVGFDDLDNPYRALDVPFEVVRESAPRGAYFWVRLWIILQLLVVLAGTAGAFFNVESIVASGPILLIVGVPGTITCFRKRSHLGTGITASGPVFSLAVFLTIYFLDWTPAQAKEPVPKMAFAYMTVFCAAALVALWQTRSVQAGGSTQAKEQSSEMRL